MKICGRCKVTKPLSDFFFRRDRNCYCSKCKSCFTAYQREYKSRPEIILRQKDARASWQRSASERNRRNIDIQYAKKLLTAKTQISARDLPMELIDLKRVQIAVARILKEEK